MVNYDTLKEELIELGKKYNIHLMEYHFDMKAIRTLTSPSGIMEPFSFDHIINVRFKRESA